MWYLHHTLHDVVYDMNDISNYVVRFVRCSVCTCGIRIIQDMSCYIYIYNNICKNVMLCVLHRTRDRERLHQRLSPSPRKPRPRATRNNYVYYVKKPWLCHISLFRNHDSHADPRTLPLVLTATRHTPTARSAAVALRWATAPCLPSDCVKALHLLFV